MSTTRPSALAAGILAMLLVATVAVSTAAADPEQKYRFTGYGTDHGVGLSQRGAAGRAKAGQTYDQILQHYFYRVKLDTVPKDTTIRALVIKSYQAGTGKTTLVQGGNICVKRSDAGACLVREKSRWTFDTPGVGDQTFPYSSRLVLIGRGASGAWDLEVHDAHGGVTLRVTDTDARLTVRPITSETARGRLLLSIRPNTRSDHFEGVLRFGRADGRIRVVNVVPIEPFVRSVTPHELGPANLPDTLKAQAVAARSYFLAGRSPDTGFLAYDVQSWRDGHSYTGSKGENKVVSQAVNATAYEVLKYRKSDGDWYIVRAFYHAVGGGATEASQNVFTVATGKPGTKTSYLRGGPDVDEDGVPYDVTAPAYAWHTRAFTLDELSAILAKDSRTNVGKLTSWPFGSEASYRAQRAAAIASDPGDPTPSPSYRGVSGRLTWVVLKGVKNGKDVEKRVAGWLFESVFNRHRGSGDPLGSTMIFRTVVD
jgi:stage II sporulation protein D